MSPAHLALVDTETGEVVEDGCPDCGEAGDKIAGLERTVTNLGSTITKLKRDAEKEAKRHPRRNEIEAIFDLWRDLCRHPNSKLDAARTFRIAWGIDTYGAPLCELAIRGAALEPFTTTRKNGTAKRHDGIALIFRDAEKFEEFCCRAPRQDVQTELAS